MKIYCKDCKYHIGFYCGLKWFDVCKFGGTLSKKDIEITYCSTLNFKGNCKHYKRKWYKFWVKDK